MGDSPADRTIAVLAILALARRGLSRRELAEKIGRSEKTAGRVILRLSRWVPIVEEARDRTTTYKLNVTAAQPEWLRRLASPSHPTTGYRSAATHARHQPQTLGAPR